MAVIAERAPAISSPASLLMLTIRIPLRAQLAVIWTSLGWMAGTTPSLAQTAMVCSYRSSDALLLSLALDRALGRRNITEYTQDRIWDPLGMEYEGAWGIDHAPDGIEKTGCCLVATARDFAKIGRLYLNQGEWGGRQIVSASWVRESTGIHASPGSSWEYRHMWWFVAQDRPDFMAVGHLGQFLYIDPASRVIIVRLGRSMGRLDREEWKRVFVSLSDRLR